MTDTTTATAATPGGQAVATILSGLQAIIPEAESLISAGGKNIGADVLAAEDLAAVLASAFASFAGTTGKIATTVEAYLPFAPAVTQAAIAQASAPAAPAPAAS